MRHRVVVIGAGFGGLFAIKALRNAPVDITLVNGTAYHLFQPLLYQLATGILSEGEIAPPIREVLKNQKNVDVKLGWAERVDVENKTVYVEGPGIDYTVEYDTLIVSAGSSQSYFGHEEYATYAPGMKNVDNALELRARIFAAFEIADLQPDPVERERWMTFVIVGAGPTGTEMAGQVAELAHRNLPGQYKHIDPRKARIILVDALDAVLNTFGDHLSTRALRQLHLLGVEVELNTKVVGVDATGIDVETERGPERIESMTKVWAAGVSAPPLARQIAEEAGAKTDRAGRIFVEPDLTVPGHPEIIAVGDMINLSDEKGGAGGHSGWQVRGEAGQAAPGRKARAGAVQVLRQGQPRGDLTVVGGGQHRQGAPVRVRGVADLGRGAPVLPGRVQEPGYRGVALGGQFPRARAVGADFHGAAGVRAAGVAALR
jgi:NADH dehydrogenase